MKPIRLTLYDGRDGLYTSLTFQYEGDLPRAPQRKKAVLAFLDECRLRIGAGDCIDIGQADNFSERPKVRRDDWIISRGEVND